MQVIVGESEHVAGNTATPALIGAAAGGASAIARLS